MGGTSYADFIRRTPPYTLAGIADRISSPTLIVDAEEDPFLKGQPALLATKMTAATTLARFTTAEGAGEHCHVGSMARMHQVIWVWLSWSDTRERVLTRSIPLPGRTVWH